MSEYFDLQSKIGITKHIGGLKGTKELAERCLVDETKTVLVVGSGSGIPAIRISQIYKCNVIGVDIDRNMVAVSKKNARIYGLDDCVRFLVADAAKLPFEDNSFDAIISESVTGFVRDKKKAIIEYHRVVKKGGYLGLSEITWLQQPNESMLEYTQILGGINPLTKQGWEHIVETKFTLDYERLGKLSMFGDSVENLKLLGPGYFLKSSWNMIKLYISDKETRQLMNIYAKKAKNLPKGFMDTYGYGVYIGRKK